MNPGDSQGGGQGVVVVVVVVVGGGGVVWGRGGLGRNGYGIRLKGITGGIVVLGSGGSNDVIICGLIVGGVGGMGSGTKHSITSGQIVP